MSQEARANVVATFDDPREAEAASRALTAEGFASSAIINSEIEPIGPSAGEQIENGASAGTLAGTSIGALMGAGFLAAGVVPGMVMASAASALLVTTASGAIAGTAFGAAIGGATILPDENEIAGRTVMTVLADDRSAEATHILRQNGAADAQAVAR
jgi:hypothetical protein